MRQPNALIGIHGTIPNVYRIPVHLISSFIVCSMAEEAEHVVTPDSAAQVREAVPVAVHRQVVPSHQSNFQTACHDLLKELLEQLRGRFGRRFLRYDGLITTLEFLQ